MKKNKVIRYIGSKEKLLDFLSEVLLKDMGKNVTFVDGFTGTGVVAKYFYDHSNLNIIACDMASYSEPFIKTIKITTKIEKIKSLLETISNLPLVAGDIFNEFSFGGKPKTISDLSIFDGQESASRLFFSKIVGKRIDTVRAFLNKSIAEGSISEEEKNIVLLFLLNYADKNANTTSVFGAYLKRNLKEKEVPLLDPVLLQEMGRRYNNSKKQSVDFVKGDIISSLSKIPENSLIYFDPPYNTRRYESNYHILNYIVNLNFTYKEIKQDSKTGLPSEVPVNLFGSKEGTKQVFEKMILTGLSKNKKIFISYNNEGAMSKKELLKLCKTHNLSLKEHTKTYKKFTAGEKRTEKKKTHVQEFLWEISRGK